MSSILLPSTLISQPAGLISPASRCNFAFTPTCWPLELCTKKQFAQNHSSLFAVQRVLDKVYADFTAHAAAGLNFGFDRNIHFCNVSTFVLSFKPTAANGTIFSHYHSAAITAAYAGLFLFQKNGSSLVVKYNDGSGAYITWNVSNVALAAGVNTTVVFAVGKDRIQCFESGRLKDEISWSMPVVGNSVGAISVRISNEDGAYSGFAGYISAIAVLGGVDGADRLSNNPNLIFASRKNSIWFDMGAASGGVSVSGDTVSEALSVIAGSATGAASVSGDTVSQSSSLIAGSVTTGGSVSVSGDTVTQQESIVAGTATGAALINGVTVEQSVALMAGTVSIGLSVSGDVVTEQSSIVAGSATGAASVSGDTISQSYSLTAGSVTVPGSTTLTSDDLAAIAALIDARISAGVNVTQLNGATLYGSGISSDKWRGTA